MAGTVDFIQRCYTGLVTRGDVLWLNPGLPDDLAALTMMVRYRGHALDLRFTPDAVNVWARASSATSIKIGMRDAVYELKAGDARRFRCDDSEN